MKLTFFPCEPRAWRVVIVVFDSSFVIRRCKNSRNCYRTAYIHGETNKKLCGYYLKSSCLKTLGGEVVGDTTSQNQLQTLRFWVIKTCPHLIRKKTNELSYGKDGMETFSREMPISQDS